MAMKVSVKLCKSSKVKWKWTCGLVSVTFTGSWLIAHTVGVVGAPTLADLTPEMVDASQITSRGTHAPADSLFAHNVCSLLYAIWAFPD